MATGPKIATTPLELLENDGTREQPLLSKIWAPTMCGALGFLAVIMGNWATRRPYFSGIQRHVAFTAGGAGIGKVIDDYRNQYLADRDAVYRHYIQLHPEEFPPFGILGAPWVPIKLRESKTRRIMPIQINGGTQRKKFSEVLEPWFPIR